MMSVHNIKVFLHEYFEFIFYSLQFKSDSYNLKGGLNKTWVEPALQPVLKDYYQKLRILIIFEYFKVWNEISIKYFL